MRSLQAPLRTLYQEVEHTCYPVAHRPELGGRYTPNDGTMLAVGLDTGGARCCLHQAMLKSQYWPLQASVAGKACSCITARMRTQPVGGFHTFEQDSLDHLINKSINIQLTAPVIRSSQSRAPDA